ncbi:MAG: Hsp33 family molecular chaperone HslO [Clostridiales bacterium]|nr:Hsp33 family molecular chaperone HslO [Clostridiales bacterium]
MKDKLVTALLERASVRVIALSSKNLVEHARQIHSCSPTATVALGRALSATVMMGALLKNKTDKTTLIIDGGGPSGRILCTAKSDTNVKGFITNPTADTKLNSNGEFDVGSLVGKDGFIRIIRDMGLKNPYSGLCNLISGEIADDLAQYYLQSEQQPSVVSLGVQIDKDKSVLTSGGIMIMPMPGCEGSIIDKLESRIMFTTDMSRQLEVYEIEDFLNSLFKDMGLEIASLYEPRYVCECSEEIIEQVLQTLEIDELKDMLAKDKGASITCHFCNSEYKFDENALKKIIKNKNEKNN